MDVAFGSDKAYVQENVVWVSDFSLPVQNENVEHS